MYRDKDGSLTFAGGMSITAFAIFFILGVVVLLMWGCPAYNVYSSRKDGEAVLAHAQYSREVAVAEAKAKMESAALLAQADTIRAHGIAHSNEIIGKSLENNPAYLNWLWIDELKETKNQIIYVPAGEKGIPLMQNIGVKPVQ
jgi:regulator of protease activity HflC (stomatin/prohibitin superfamily)